MIDGASPTFGESLRRYRVSAGLTQEQLAERAGLSARGISDLERGVNLTPRRDTLALLVDALELSADDRAMLASLMRRRASPPQTAGPYALPAPLTSLIGRERQAAVGSGLLRRHDVRLVTLIGPGGVGKTRLAIEVANELRSDFPDGICFVALASVRDPRLVTSTIAQALGVREAGSGPLATRVQMFLRDKQLLLVLDNFEQLQAAAPVVSDLLSACTTLKALVTSRAVLHLSGEHDLRVSPLDLPREVTVQGDDAAKLAAVRLFADRARAASPDFVLTPENTATVVAICNRLDGLPLAIELAAARIGHLSPEAVLARLDRRLPLLTGGASDQPARLRSMRDAIAWSYDLLRAEERTLLRRLATFVGGFTLDASEAIGWHDGECDGATVALDAVCSLADKSLLQSSLSGGSEPRFEMLETVREFALEHLESDQDAATTRDAHGRFFLAMAERAAPHLTGPQQVGWLDRLEIELGNIRAAMEWELDQDQAEEALRMAVALSRFWDYHSHLSEGRRWLETALAHPGTAALPPGLQGKAFHAAGVLARSQGAYPHARDSLTHALELFRQDDDLIGMGFALNSLGTVALYMGEPNRARTLHLKGLAIMREVGDPDGIAALLANLGYGALLRGDHRNAIEHCEESLTLYRELGSKLGSANVLSILGRSLLELGDHARASRLLREGLALDREVGNKWYIAECVEGLAGVLAASHPARAVRLFAAADALCERIGMRLPSFDRVTNERYLARARRLLDEETMAAAWNAGRGMPLEQVIDEVLADDT